MRIQFKKGLYITHSRERWLLDEINEDIRDAFCFENTCEISKERYKIFMKEVKSGNKISKNVSGASMV